MVSVAGIAVGDGRGIGEGVSVPAGVGEEIGVVVDGSGSVELGEGKGSLGEDSTVSVDDDTGIVVDSDTELTVEVSEERGMGVVSDSLVSL